MCVFLHVRAHANNTKAATLCYKSLIKCSGVFHFFSPDNLHYVLAVMDVYPCAALLALSCGNKHGVSFSATAHRDTGSQKHRIEKKTELRAAASAFDNISADGHQTQLIELFYFIRKEYVKKDEKYDGRTFGVSCVFSCMKASENSLEKKLQL